MLISDKIYKIQKKEKKKNEKKRKNEIQFILK